MTAATQLHEQFRETIVGLRTGQTGRANYYLKHLVSHILAALEGESETTLGKVAPLVSAMLAAQERRDLITVADLLEYELPAAFSRDLWSG